MTGQIGPCPLHHALRYAATVPRRLVTLPSRGRLIVATDIQGHARDFARVADVYEKAVAEEPETYLVVTGDLVHGPEIAEEDWPDYLGSFYHGDSREVLRHARDLQERHGKRIHYLLGNHEHAHVGGPVVSKFFADEAERLENILGAIETARFHDWLRTWPFVAVAPGAGIVLSHAAPHAHLESAEDLDRLPLESFNELSTEDVALRTTLGALLWARTTSTERARAFLRAFDEAATTAVFGHDVARAGYAIDREPLLCLSTSFGCFDGDKLYLDWPLDQLATGPEDIAERGLRPLYPDVPPVFRLATMTA